MSFTLILKNLESKGRKIFRGTTLVLDKSSTYVFNVNARKLLK